MQSNLRIIEVSTKIRIQKVVQECSSWKCSCLSKRSYYFSWQFLIVIMLSFLKFVSHKLNWDIFDGFKKIDRLTTWGALMNSCEGARRITGPGKSVTLSMRHWLSSRRWTTWPARTLWVHPSQVVNDAEGRLNYSRGDAETVSQLGSC